MGKSYRVRCREINDNFNGTFVFNNATLEAPGLLPGELAEVSLLYGKDKGKAVVNEIIEASDKRINPPCPVYRECGGCSLMHMTYDNQLQIKENYCRKLLSKFGKVSKIEGMDNPYNYRNKIHSTFSKNKKGDIVSGLYEETSHRVVEVDKCLVEDERASEVIKTIRELMKKYRVMPYNEDKGVGIIRHVLLRVAENGDTLVAIVVGSNVFPEKHKFAEKITANHPFVKSVVLNYNLKKTSLVLGEREEILAGSGFIVDRMCGIEFRISAKSFYQVNRVLAERIYMDAIREAGIGAKDKVLDAYCGIGTIGLAVAKHTGAERVVGVELNGAAVADAISNAKRSGLSNVTFVQGDAGDYLDSVGSEEKFSCIIMDPPRSGASLKFIKSVLRMKPEKIIYISCNPVTLARDLSELTKKNYRAELIRPYDMFCHSSHVETVVLMSKVNTFKG